MRNKRESGLKRSVEVEAEDIPRIGDTIIYRSDKNEVFAEGKVYEIFRDITRKKIQKEDPNIKYQQRIPIVRALARKMKLF